MNLQKFVTCLAAAAATMLPAAVNASVTAYDLPDWVESVDPPQGIVDLSNNANPLGLTQISVAFKTYNVESNPDVTTYVTMYKDGSDVIYDQVPASSATVDQYTHQYGSIIFEHKHTEEGTYYIHIPRGTWLLSGDMSPEINLSYEIRELTTITPAPGMVDDLDNVTIKFNYADKVAIKSNSLLVAATGSTEDCQTSVVIKSEDGRENIVDISIAGPDGGALTPATYTVFIPEGTFSLTTYGENYPTDASDVTTEVNAMMVLQYVIPSFPKQPIEPAEGEVDGFLDFTITPNSDFQLSMVDDKTRSYIYKVNDDGELASEATYRLLAKSQSGTVYLYIIDSSWEALTEKAVPEEGRYALVLADGLFYGMYNGSFEKSAAYTYYYDVVKTTTGVKIVSVNPETSGNVYDLSGVKVATISSGLNNLPTGIYVVNGKKILIK